MQKKLLRVLKVSLLLTAALIQTSSPGRSMNEEFEQRISVLKQRKQDSDLKCPLYEEGGFSRLVTFQHVLPQGNSLSELPPEVRSFRGSANANESWCVRCKERDELEEEIINLYNQRISELERHKQTSDLNCPLYEGEEVSGPSTFQHVLPQSNSLSELPPEVRSFGRSANANERWCVRCKERDELEEELINLYMDRQMEKMKKLFASDRLRAKSDEEDKDPPSHFLLPVPKVTSTYRPQ